MTLSLERRSTQLDTSLSVKYKQYKQAVSIPGIDERSISESRKAIVDGLNGREHPVLDLLHVARASRRLAKGIVTRI